MIPEWVLVLIIVVSWASGLVLGHLIGWHRAMKKIRDYGRLLSAGEAELLRRSSEKPRIKQYGGFWSARRGECMASGSTAQEAYENLIRSEI